MYPLGLAYTGSSPVVAALPYQISYSPAAGEPQGVLDSCTLAHSGYRGRSLPERWKSSREDAATHAVSKYEILDDSSPERPNRSFSTPSDKILNTRWHEYSNDEMHVAVSQLTASTQGTPADDPCYSIMRVLSSAFHNLTRARQELEESRRVLLEKEAAQKERAKQLLSELQPSDKEIGKRVFQSLFPDDNGSTHQVHRMARQQSLMVSTHIFCCSSY